MRMHWATRSLLDILAAHPPSAPTGAEPPNLDRKSLDRELESARWNTNLADALEIAEAVAALPVASHPEVVEHLDTVRAIESWESGIDLIEWDTGNLRHLLDCVALLAVIRDRYAPPKED